MLAVIRTKGGRVKRRATRTVQVLDETVEITIRRECIFKSLIYLGEPVEHLIKEYQESEADKLEQATKSIFVTGEDEPFHPSKDIKMVRDGTQVLNEVPSIAIAVAMVFGLVYALNIQRNLQYTLGFVQKVLMELGAS